MPDLRSLRVAQTTSQLLQAKHLKQQPAWLPSVARIPPSTDFSRKIPPKFGAAQSKAKKLKQFRLNRIEYPEDALRERFFREHPWELARPVLLLENSGHDHKHYDWSQLVQPGKQLTGESVVHRQLWLIKNGYSKANAYKLATTEFYRERRREAVEKRIAVEEALSFGVKFNKFETQIGLELEEKVVADWRKKAIAAKGIQEPARRQDINTLTTDAS